MTTREFIPEVFSSINYEEADIYIDCFVEFSDDCVTWEKGSLKNISDNDGMNLTHRFEMNNTRETYIYMRTCIDTYNDDIKYIVNRTFNLNDLIKENIDAKSLQKIMNEKISPTSIFQEWSQIEEIKSLYDIKDWLIKHKFIKVFEPYFTPYCIELLIGSPKQLDNLLYRITSTMLSDNRVMYESATYHKYEIKCSYDEDMIEQLYEVWADQKAKEENANGITTIY